MNRISRLYPFFLISLGAIPGALARWIFSNSLIVNIIGSLLLGIVYGMKSKSNFRLVLGIGFSGSLTTFSGWILEVYNLILKGKIFDAICLTSVMIFFGILSGFGGYLIGKRLHS